MDKNKKLALDVLDAVGGAQNINKVWHCSTRLRFNLNDMKVPDKEAIKNIDGVLGVVESGEQLQIIVGPHVAKVYDELCKESGAEAQEAIDENLDAAKEKLTLKKIGQNILDYLSGSMTPLIPVMVTASMFKTIAVVFGPDMLGMLTAESNLYVLCNFLYDAFFYFLPIYLGYTAAKKMGVNVALGLFTGCMLLVPEFVAMKETDIAFTVYGIPCPVNNYSQTIFPVILSVWVMRYVERFFKKVIPDSLSSVFVPFLTMAVMVPITFCGLAPLGSEMGQILGKGLVFFGEHGGFIAVAVVAAIWEFLVMSGMHIVVGMFGVTTMLTVGVEYFAMPAGSVATFAAFGMALGAWLRLKGKNDKSLALGYFISGIIGGVTEPTLYGIGFRYKRPFVAMVIGGFLGGLYAGITKVGVYVKMTPNILTTLGYTAGGAANMINGCISLAIALIATAVITYFFGFSKEEIQGK